MDRHLEDHDDLQQAMKQEAMEDQRAEAKMAWYDGMQEAPEDQMREELNSLRSDVRDQESNIRDLKRQLEKAQQEKREKERKKDWLVREIRQEDPEIIIDIQLHDTKRGRIFGWDVEKCPPISDLETDDVAGPGIPDEVRAKVGVIVEDLDEEDFEVGEKVMRLSFEDYQSEPELEWL